MSNKTKILIAAPCFQDAQHAFGSNNLFVDSYEWINFLGKKSEKLTQNNNKLQINLALNYGSRNEIVNTIKSLNRKKIKINEKNINNHLYTSNIPDPDILIRTGNTNRLSNFLLWQLSYSEIFFSRKFWPEFTETDYLKIINKFKIIKRNFGEI